ncbi:uncharacterized protein LOC6600594 [Drosophila persimilis]|uniref:uncharacterized protein LOC6600594 n=1 Tax=Drosophila persimilis TaxID=7234 RepID=UPI000F07FBC7|nr:uncharacterized protein LOC6600594 [Drosophila persimilis]
MDFFTIILTGASAESVAREYASAFIAAIFADPHNWHVKVSHKFVGQCFKVLGLKFNVSVKAFRETQDHPYRNDNSNYIFDVVPFVMTTVDSFLDILPTLLVRYTKGLEQERNTSQTPDDKRFDEMTDLLACYLKVVFTWTKVVHSIFATMHQEPSADDKYLYEPVARMSFSILCGLAKLLPTHSDSFDGFKLICLTLTIDARYGLFYKATSRLILKPMLDMFREHFGTFCSVENSALGFVYYVLTIVREKDDNYIMAYEFLESMLKQLAENQQKDQCDTLYLRHFTNELITDKFLALQFEVFKTSKNKPLLVATLQYILTLQRHIVSAERFPMRFHEIILELLIRLPRAFATVHSMAAELYVALAQRQYTEMEIGIHIMETYIKSQHSRPRNLTFAQFRVQLTRYLKKLMQHFPAAKRFDIYVYLITAEEVRIEQSLIAAQCICVLFDLHRLEYSASEESREQMHKLLRVWPALISSQQKATRAVLYSVYSAVDFMAVASHDLELLLTLETFCLDMFLHDETLSESEFYGLYKNLSYSVRATGNSQLYITAAQALQDEYAQLQAELNATDVEATQREDPELLEAFAQYLRRLHALLRANHNKLSRDHLAEIMDTLATNLLKRPQQNDKLSLFGSESLAYILIRLHNAQQRGKLKDRDLIGLAKQLRDFCVCELSKPAQDFKRTKFFFCSVILLHLGLKSSFQLDDETYDVLLRCLTVTTWRSHTSCNQLIQRYMQEMHILFRRMITCDQIVFPNNRVWKVLLHNNVLRKAPQVLKSELQLLVCVLLEHRICSFVHCLPVIQLRFSNKNTANKWVVDTLRLIKDHASVMDAWVLRWIVFKDSINLLLKNMSVLRLEATNSYRNRLVPLQHLQLIVTSMRLKEVHFQYIGRSIYGLKKVATGSKERAKLETFINHISAFKYRCEDEHSAASTSEDFEGKLMPLPPGPMTLWQHESMKDLDLLKAK